jgi:hypothetical protein
MRVLYYVIRRLRSLFVDRPNRNLTWSVEDFRLARKWALSQPDPMGQRSSLWARIYSPRKDSVDILDEINTLTGCK